MDKVWPDDLMITAHEGDNPEQFLGAVTPPLFMNSLHVFPDVKAYQTPPADGSPHFVYGRAGNPTVTIAEEKLALLEHACGALAYGSGMAACTSAIMATCKAGSHVICVRNSYGPTRSFLDTFCTDSMNMTITYVTGEDNAEIEAAICPETRLIMLESPTTFRFSICDLRGIAAIAKKHGIYTYIDNTYCTPLFQKPLDMGIDIVMHTASKYLGGHSDIIGGVLAVKDPDMLKRLNGLRSLFGGILGPMEAFLLIRGMRTLDVRLERHEKTTLAVAQYLEKHPKVKQVYYPGLPSHPQYELMKSQQKGNTGLMAFELDCRSEQTIKFVNSLKIFGIGCSWGGFESLVLPVMNGASEEAVEFMRLGTETVRIHCGLEGAEALIADLEQALATI